MTAERRPIQAADLLDDSPLVDHWPEEPPRDDTEHLQRPQARVKRAAEQRGADR